MMSWMAAAHPNTLGACLRSMVLPADRAREACRNTCVTVCVTVVVLESNGHGVGE
jgi:hypothetical protein